MHKKVVKTTMSVDKSMLDDPQCCNADNSVEMPKTCKYPYGYYDGVCSNGKCIGLCARFMLAPCPLTNDGCLQPCKYLEQDRKCYDDLKTTGSGPGTVVRVSWQPDGTPCSKYGAVCSSGVCQGAKNPPTLKLTPKPTTRPTHEPTLQPTYYPTFQPTLQPSTPRFPLSTPGTVLVNTRLRPSWMPTLFVKNWVVSMDSPSHWLAT